jgi:hypothetical protein
MRYSRARFKGGTYFFIRNHEDLRRHVEYIHYNPVKHGLTKAPGDWDYSSFHRYVNEGMYDNKQPRPEDVVLIKPPKSLLLPISCYHWEWREQGIVMRACYI